jgi:NADH dehydrogenase
MKTVVIFGGSGFIGQNIIRRLAKRGYLIIVPYQTAINDSELRLYGNVGQIILLKFKRLSENKIKNIIHRADIIINLKTIWREKKYHSYEKNILNFNVQLVDLINKTNKNSVFIFFSGIGVSKLSSSKRVNYIAQTEEYIINNLKNALIIRPSIVIGDGDQFLRKILPIIKYCFLIPIFGDGDAKLQPVFVDDVANAIEIIIEKDNKHNDIYELVGSEILTYRSLYQFISKSLGLKRKFIPISFGLANMAVSIIEKTTLNLITKDQLLLLKEDNISSNKYKNFKSLGISPNDIREIIKKIIY